MKTFIDKKLRELDKKFLNPNTLDSSHLYRPELEGKVYPEFKSFLKQVLEESYEKGYQDCRKFFEMEKDIIMKDYLKLK